MAPATIDPAKKDRFVNESGGILGVSVRAPGTATGFKGIPLYPRQEIDLDEEEQAMTANAPRDPRANPLANGQLVCVAEGMDFKGRRPLRPDAHIASADPTRPDTWSPEQRAHVESEAERLAAEQEALQARISAEAETGIAFDPSMQPPVGAYADFEESGTTTGEQPPVVGGATVQGSVETPIEGEAAVLPTPYDEEPEIEETFPAALSEIRGPADRLQPPAPQVQQGSLQGTDKAPKPRRTATP